MWLFCLVVVVPTTPDQYGHISARSSGIRKKKSNYYVPAQAIPSLHVSKVYFSGVFPA